MHVNVLRLRVQKGLLESVVDAVIGHMPSTVRNWLESLLPEWTIPTELILKSQKRNWGDEFAAEKVAYTKLRPLQGVVVPRLFGEVYFEGTVALLMTDIGGIALTEPGAAMLELSEFQRLLGEALDALCDFGVLHDDLKLDNFHLVGSSIKVVDFEMTIESGVYPTDEGRRTRIDNTISHLMDAYQSNRDCFCWKSVLSVPVG